MSRRRIDNVDPRKCPDCGHSMTVHVSKESLNDKHDHYCVVCKRSALQTRCAHG